MTKHVPDMPHYEHSDMCGEDTTPEEPNMTIKKLHLTLRACKCGFIGTRTQLYKHFEVWKLNMPTKAFFEEHGEVPFNEDDPRVPEPETTMEDSPLPWET
jgi:hypothetical protein